jgi:4-hydroxythreonine-4-phosphate dehydrogenase
MGDPAGIGPEILARALANAALRREAHLAAVGDPEVLGRAARLAHAAVRLDPVAPEALEFPDGDSRAIPLVVSGTDAWGSIEPGRPSAASGRAAARAIEIAAAIALRRGADALVTAPISKQALQAAGYPFPGHTEFLGSLSGARETRMLFTGGRFRILLATIHVALKRVSDSLETGSLVRTIEYAAAALRNFRWGLKKRIAVLALNPHAGEGGLFGDEESRVIAPAIEEARGRGIRAEGPFPADTFFAHRAIGGDLGVIVAMYHDQGLIPAKMGGIGGAANVTLGLPFIRASVDHGTAYDRAWKRGGRPDPAGLIKAARVAVDLAARSRGRRLEWAWP